MSGISRTIDTVLFDWDGTLFDSACAGLIAFQKTFSELGVDFTPDFYEANYSPNWYTMYEALSIPPERWRTADELWLRHYGEQPPKLVDGGQETIVELLRRGYRLGIVTSGSYSRVDREIRALGLDGVFLTLITNESTINKKPHPEGLEKAIELLNTTREACCYVGDSAEDIQMGRAAQVLTVAVPSAYPTRRRLADANPDIRVDSISGLLTYLWSRES